MTAAPQRDARPASYDEVIANPLFREGYAEIWLGLEQAIDIRWTPEDQEAYERGRAFGLYVREADGGRVPLTRGFLPHPRARHLLMMAFIDGAVL